MNNVSEILNGIKTVGIAGHVRPDGDCVGSCMAFYLYLKKYYPELDVDIFLEEPKPVFGYISRIEEFHTDISGYEDKIYDLFVVLDVSSKDRIGVAEKLYDQAKKTVCIDHHVSNNGFSDINHIRGEIGSASEVLYSLLDADKIDRELAEPIYTGMIHDTGIFQYTSTAPSTLQIAAELMKTGIDFNSIIEKSFYERTYLQTQVLGRVLAESILVLDGKCIVGCIRRKDMRFYGVEPKDLDSIIAQLRMTKDIEAAIFIYEYDSQKYKVSLRSNGCVDVCKVAEFFGGGGHVKAAGCSMVGSHYDVINNLTAEIAKQLPEEC